MAKNSLHVKQLFPYTIAHIDRGIKAISLILELKSLPKNNYKV